MISKLINLSKRLINKDNLFGKNTSTYAYNFLTSLLNISRSIVYAYDFAIKKNFLIEKAEMNLIQETKELYQDLISAYQNIDIEKIKSFLKKREEISDESLEVLNNRNPIITHFFLGIFKEFSAISNFVIVLHTNEEQTLR